MTKQEIVFSYFSINHTLSRRIITYNFSISGSSATIYAYLSEFHSNVRRDRAIMGSALIFGISCLLLPLIAFAVINGNWQYEFSYLHIVYKPWRLFLLICGLPGLLSYVALIFLPESPKFMLSQGKQAETIAIIEQINRWNNGKSVALHLTEIYEESESIKNRERNCDNQKSRFPLIKTIYNQTAQLFKPPHCGSTILLCSVQFFIYYTSNG